METNLAPVDGKISCIRNQVFTHHLRLVVEMPLFTFGFRIHPNGACFGMGFLKHQQLFAQSHRTSLCLETCGFPPTFSHGGRSSADKDLPIEHFLVPGPQLVGRTSYRVIIPINGLNKSL